MISLQGVPFLVEEGLAGKFVVRRLCEAGAVLSGRTFSAADSVLRGAPFAVGRAPQLAPFTHGVCGYGPAGILTRRLEDLVAIVRLLEGYPPEGPQDWSRVTVSLGDVPRGLPRPVMAAAYKVLIALRERGAQLVEESGELVVLPCWPGLPASEGSLAALRVDTDPQGFPLGIQLLGEGRLTLQAAQTLQEVFGLPLPEAQQAEGRSLP
jgi:hypothetical protein